MKIRSNPSCPGIKQIPRTLVKRVSVIISILGVLMLALPSMPARAEDNLPSIDARTFDVTVQRRSRSGRVYLFETPSQEPLHVGKLILLRQSDLPVMAFRVLKDYPEKNQFAAKWMRRYRNIPQIEPKQQYLAVEKLADRNAPPLTEQDRAELKEIESDSLPPPPDQGAPLEEAKPAPNSTPPTTSDGSDTTSGKTPGAASGAPSYDADLDATTTPPPKNNVESTLGSELTPADEQELDDLKSITAEELVPLDRDKNGVTVGFGFFRNNASTADQSSGYLGGLDIKYAHTLRQYLYFKRKNLQDSLMLEGGFGYYKLISYAAQNDSYTVVPFTVTLRYNLLFNENFGTFGYIGLNKNFVAASAAASSADSGAVQEAARQLNSFNPAIGVGVLFRVGPSWYIRMDAGYDLIGVALLLRF